MEPLGITAEAIELADRAIEAVRYIRKHIGFSLKWLLRGVDVEDVLSRLDDADRRILIQMPVIQKPMDVTFNESARYLIERIYEEHGAFINLINSHFFKSIFLKRIKIKQALDIEVTADLKQMKYSSKTNSITTYNQKLLWPCNCKVPSKYRNTAIRCPIHSENSGEIIENAFRTGVVRILFRDIEIIYRNTETIWPPSIDSLYFAQLLEKYFGTSSNLKRIVDIGAGTGFLGIFLSKINNSVKRVIFSDIFLSPVFLSMLNFYRNSKDRNVKYNSIASDAFDKMRKDDKYDLIICNPPYLPLLGTSELAGISAVSGTYLLDRVISDSGKFSDHLVFATSDIAKPELNKCLAKAKEQYPMMSVSEIGKIDVPFRVAHAFKTSGYMSKLLKARKKYFSIREDSPFKLWHNITYYHITYR